MKDWRIWASDTVVKWWKQLGILGWVRFRVLRVFYKLAWNISPRNGEWDFVLGWMKPLRKFQGKITVADIGATESLLCYELEHRGYWVEAIDQRLYQEDIGFRNNVRFTLWDITVPYSSMWDNYFDYIISISVIEHIGLGAYEDKPFERGDRLAVENIHKMLKDNGYFIITVPNKHLGTDTGRGYSYQDFEKLIEGLFRIVHLEERSNQICAVLVKSLS